MKSLKKILFFISVPLTLFLIAEIAASQMFLRHSDMYLKFDDFNKQKKNIEMLFLGNSHIEKGVNPDIVSSKSFNLAYSAQDLYYNYKILKKYISQMPELQTLVIGIDPFAFFYDESINSMYFVKDYFYKENILPKNGFSFLFLLNSSTFWLNRGKIFQRIATLDFHKSMFDYQNADSFNNMQNEGQYLLSNGQRLAIGQMTEKALKHNAELTIRRILMNSNTELIEENKKFLIEMIKLAKSKNIKIYLIYSPVSENYRKLIPEKISSVARNAVEEICKMHPEVIIFDFSAIFDIDQNLFYNSDHLNKAGSIKFSRILSDSF